MLFVRIRRVKDRHARAAMTKERMAWSGPRELLGRLGNQTLIRRSEHQPDAAFRVHVIELFRFGDGRCAAIRRVR